MTPLQERVTALETEMERQAADHADDVAYFRAELRAFMSETRGRIEGIEARLEKIQARLSRLETDVALLKVQMQALLEHFGIVIGHVPGP